MKNFWIRFKLFLLEDSAMDSLIKAHDRCKALEDYVANLRWAVERMGYDPETHGYPPSLAQPQPCKPKGKPGCPSCKGEGGWPCDCEASLCLHPDYWVVCKCALPQPPKEKGGKP